MERCARGPAVLVDAIRGQEAGEDRDDVHEYEYAAADEGCLVAAELFPDAPRLGLAFTGWTALDRQVAVVGLLHAAVVRIGRQLYVILGSTPASRMSASRLRMLRSS